MAFNYIILLCRKLWRWLRCKIPFFRFGDQGSEEDFDWSNPSSQTKFRSHGLEENIALPATGKFVSILPVLFSVIEACGSWIFTASQVASRLLDLENEDSRTRI